MEYSINMDKEDIAYLKFINEFGSGYDSLLLQSLAMGFSESVSKRYDYIACVRSYMDLDDEEKDRYKGYFKFLTQEFKITSNILEIGSGTSPTLAHYIDDMQTSKKKGSIEIYDPELVTTNLGNIITNKSLFIENDKVKEKDLIIGMTPRGATELIVRTANKYKKPFSILMCPDIGKSSKYDEDVNELLKLIEETKEDNLEIKVTHLDESYLYPYPIVYKK